MKLKTIVTTTISALAVATVLCSCGTNTASVRPTEAPTTAPITTTAITTVLETVAETTTVKPTETTQTTTKKAVVTEKKKTSPTAKKVSATKKKTTTTKKKTTTTKKTVEKQYYDAKWNTIPYDKNGNKISNPKNNEYYYDADGYKFKYFNKDLMTEEEKKDDGICQHCKRVIGDGRNGTCNWYLVDTNCDFCGKQVKACECHSCDE